MSTQNISEFLLRFPVQVLKEKGILRGVTNQLKATSIEPLISLMKENRIDRLEYPDINWFLNINLDFSNSGSIELKKGNVSKLANPGSVFNLTNTTINPYFNSNNLITNNEKGIDELEEITFKLERDLQKALRKNIEQLETGLKVIDGGIEKSVEAGRIDITAKDQNDNIVVIELKAGEAQPKSLTQILAYMASLSKQDQNLIRGLLVAADFHPKLVLAAKLIPSLQLKQYSFNFTFRDK